MLCLQARPRWTRFEVGWLQMKFIPSSVSLRFCIVLAVLQLLAWTSVLIQYVFCPRLNSEHCISTLFCMKAKWRLGPSCTPLQTWNVRVIENVFWWFLRVVKFPLCCRWACVLLSSLCRGCHFNDFPLWARVLLGLCVSLGSFSGGCMSY